METKIKNLGKSELEMEVELTSQEWEEYLDLAALELSQELKMDGFRPGKAPRSVVEAMVGSQRIMEVAAETAIRKSYIKTIIDNKLEAIGQPEVQVLKIGLGSPFIFKAKVAVLPEFEMGDYAKLAREVKEKLPVDLLPTDKDVENVLNELRKLRAMKEGGDKTEKGDKEELVLPELNDEFARSVGKFDNLEALKGGIREGLGMENQQKEKQRWRIEVINKIASAIKVELPEILILSELDKMLIEFKENIVNMGMEFDKYLGEIKQTEEDLKKGWRDQAVNRVTAALILKAIANKEKLVVTDEEIEAEISKFIRHYDPSEVNKIDMGYLKEYTKGILRNEKVFQLLESSRV